MIVCANCGADNPAGKRFCGDCGSALATICSSCGGSNAPGKRFCGDCGSPLEIDAVSRAAPGAAPAAERRLVSVLFADLVGFTAWSESRDAEETRDLLSRYFELARTLIGRYGGTVEKFIGDAVMAVWGTPVATESDPERAVRAALELVASVPELDPALAARAGVLTGEAAVTIGAEGEGMVAGDLVNTASRIQSAAEPGSVLVGEVTRRATEQAIVYESAGEEELKGKAEPVALWRALRVVSGVGGQLKSAGLEAPFVGREREFKLIKELFHDYAAERKAHLVSVTGIAGIGKSRLAWEFYKYFDGIVESVYRQRGRCLAYGEGVAYWALADMVRMRCGISEDEQPASARPKLQATLEEHLLDPEERAFVEPRLAHLLGLDEAAAGDREDLFAAWRLFFERLADAYPTVLAFEDMQWADTSLLDFVEYLLEWSRDYPIYVITMARGQMLAVVLLLCERGDLDGARALLTDSAMLRETDNWQLRTGYGAVEARLLRAEGRPVEALAAAERTLASLGELSTDVSAKAALVEATEAALTVSDLEKTEELLTIPESLDPGELTPYLRANTARLNALLAAARGDREGVEDRFGNAVGLFREFGLVFHVAVTQLEHAEWLMAQDLADDAEPLLAEARRTFEQLQATPWLERTAQAAATRGEPETAIS